ncbi:DUF3519 domain-containing protein [Helicobacter pylori]|nr:DUF3519 domain-containing protein [Helicobacter pylori]AFI00504.1 hypothetical protein HPSH112_01415 [Helicobacter pylori Shi112]
MKLRERLKLTFLFKKQPLYKCMRVGLNDKWDNQKLENKWVISSYEIYNSEGEPPSLLMAQLQGVGLGTPKLTEPNLTTNALKNQESYKMVFMP